MSHSMQPVGFSQLLDWHEGLLSEPENRAVEQALDKGGELARQLGWLEAFGRMREGMKMAHAPKALVRRIYVQFEPRRRDLKMVRCFVASLSFDSRMRHEPASVRNGQGEGLSRQLVYNTDLADVALSVCAEGASGDCMWLQGQLLWRRDEESEPLEVRIEDGADSVDCVPVDSLGEFAFNRLEPGRYRLRFTGEDVAILIDDVTLEV